MFTNIKDKLTIVIPTYNEENYIGETLSSIAKQNNIRGTRVIVADGFSKDKTRQIVLRLREELFPLIDIELVNGGKVAYARNFGASLVTTKYTLFLDGDSPLVDNNNICYNLTQMYQRRLDLLTCKVKNTSNDIRATIAFTLFNMVNRIISIGTPFAVGGYFLTHTQRFKEYGMFDESLDNSEDYMLSKKYKTKKFHISKMYYGQDNRRFKKMGYFGMVKLLIVNFFQRNNIEHFRKDSGYWN